MNTLSYRQRALNQWLSEIENICKELELSGDIISVAKENYLLVMNQDRIYRGHMRNCIILGCIIHATKLEDNNCYLHFRDCRDLLTLIEQKKNISSRSVKKGYDIVCKINGCFIKPEQFKPVDLIDRYTPKLQLEEEVVKIVMAYAKICNDCRLLSDHTSHSIASACVFMAMKKKDPETNLKIISKIFTTNEISIFRAYKKLEIFIELALKN